MRTSVGLYGRRRYEIVVVVVVVVVVVYRRDDVVFGGRLVMSFSTSVKSSLFEIPSLLKFAVRYSIQSLALIRRRKS